VDQIAFAFELRDGRSGIVIWTPPSGSPAARLNIAFEAASGKLTVSWPAALAGWTLEQTSNVADRQSWRPTGIQPVKMDQELQGILPAEEGQRFFRLKPVTTP
jgi:hypothetical protein